MNRRDERSSVPYSNEVPENERTLQIEIAVTVYRHSRTDPQIGRVRDIRTAVNDTTGTYTSPSKSEKRCTQMTTYHVVTQNIRQ